MEQVNRDQAAVYLAQRAVIRNITSVKRGRSALAKWLERAARWVRGRDPKVGRDWPNIPHGAVVLGYDVPQLEKRESSETDSTMRMDVFGHGATPEQRAALRKILDIAADRAFDVLHPRRQDESGSRKL